MLTLELDMYQACALGALVYCLGRLLVQKLPFLSKYCIPAPVAGGVVFAFAHLALYATGVLELSFDTTLQSVFMTIFFCSVGFTACFRLLKKGGVQVFMFLALAVGICIVQDAVGSGLAAAFGLNPLLGLCMGSMPLVGGHGTSGSFGPPSGAGIRSCRRNYSCPGIRYIWSGIRQYDGWSYRPCPC